MYELKKPSNYARLNDDELTYDGGGKMPWWGWVIVGVGAATMIGLSVYGGVKMHNANVAKMMAPTEEAYVTVPFKDLMKAGGLPEFEKRGFSYCYAGSFDKDGPVYTLAIKRRA